MFKQIYHNLFEVISKNINGLFCKPMLGMYIYLVISKSFIIYKNLEIIKNILFQIYLIAELFIFIISFLLLLVWTHYQICGFNFTNNLVEDYISSLYPRMFPSVTIPRFFERLRISICKFNFSISNKQFRYKDSYQVRNEKENRDYDIIENDSNENSDTETVVEHTNFSSDIK